MSRDAAFLVQLLLPLRDAEGTSFPATHFAALRAELTERFGGLTAYTRAPAEGLWAEAGQEARPERDDIVVYEVMTQDVDRVWWSDLRKRLEQRFQQEELVIRALPMSRL
jgi:hypothetical protein